MFDIEAQYGLKLVKDLVRGEKNLSRIYGFILYTEGDPFVIQMLRNRDYWNALNHKSGSNWPIFAVRPQNRESQRYEDDNRFSGMIRYMVPTSGEPKSNLSFLQEFGLEESDKLPLFVAFMWDDDDRLQQIKIPIRGDNDNSVYNSVAKIVEIITDVEKHIPDEEKRTEKVFKKVKTELQKYKLINTIKERGEIPMKLISLFTNFL